MPEYLDRIKRLKARLVGTRPEMDLENASLLTSGFQEMEGHPLIMKKAHAFRKQCLEKTIFIADDELVVGNSGSKIRGGILCADSCWSVLDRELDTISTRRYDPFFLRAEDRKLFEEKVRPYWKGRSIYEQWLAQAPEEATVLRDNGVVYIDRKAVRGWGETTAGYSWVLRAGIRGIAETVQARRARLDLTDPGAIDQDNFLKALLLVAEGIVALANRYAALAEEMAGKEADPGRKGELKQIARICRRVPEHPAASFREAVQSFYFYQISLFMEQNAAAYNPGRMDQDLLAVPTGTTWPRET